MCAACRRAQRRAGFERDSYHCTRIIDMRLVKGMDHHQTALRLIDHIRKQGFFIVDPEPNAAARMAHEKVAKVIERPGGYNAVRTSMDLPISQEIIRTVERARGANGAAADEWW